MEELGRRITYLRGLADGLDIGEATKEGRIVVEMVQLLDDLYAECRTLQLRIEETEDYVEAIDEDLNDLELLMYDDDDELYEMVDDDDFVVLDPDDEGEYYDLDDSEDAYLYDRTSSENMPVNESYEFECPNCDETLLFHEEVDEEGYRHYIIERSSDLQEPINPT